MALFLRCAGQRWLLKQTRLPRLSLQHVVPIGTSAILPQKEGKEDFFSKNKRLSRPISPHMTIYAPQITWLMSISHRITGVTLSAAAITLAGLAFCPSVTFPAFIQSIQNLHLAPATVVLLKMFLAFPLTFHICSGVRHLIWDMGHGFDLKTVTITGYSAIVTAVALAVGLAAM